MMGWRSDYAAFATMALAMTDLQRHLGARPYLLADHPDAGYNQRMTDIQAALGSAQMERAGGHHHRAAAAGKDL